ncbi:gag-pol polyprotein [Tanacetum coccineum]
MYSYNDHELKIIGIGSIMVKMHDGGNTKQDHENYIKGALVLMKGEEVAANLYQLKGEIIEEAKASVTASHSPSHRVAISWHQKLGHMSEQGMKILMERKLIPGLTKVYPIKKKSDVFEVFKVYKARVELDSGKKIKCLRTDNGGEYTGDEFNTFCRQERIKRQFTTSYTPQQNGVAERMNEDMQEEIEALHKNKTWELVPLPGGRKPIRKKWVYKIKRNGDDHVDRYHARLVVKGYAYKD